MHCMAPEETNEVAEAAEATEAPPAASLERTEVKRDFEVDLKGVFRCFSWCFERSATEISL